MQKHTRRYADADRIAFKSATRLECMMQDYPKELPATASVGFTVVNQARCPQSWYLVRCPRRNGDVHENTLMHCTC